MLLLGGGARAAYQVGFLRGLTQRFPQINFPIIVGVSAGAINAAFLAAHEGSNASAAKELCSIWSRLTAEHIFRLDDEETWGDLFSRWLRFSPNEPVKASTSVADTSPLRVSLREMYSADESGELPGIGKNIAKGQLRSVAVLTSQYGTGETVAWVEGVDVADWRRNSIRGINTKLSVEHVMASAALPLFFPAIRLMGGWHGDGGMRLVSPLAAVLRMGARRVLVLSTRHQGIPEKLEDEPSPLQISGHLLDSIFIDDIDRDIGEVERVNRLTLHDKSSGFRTVNCLLVRPRTNIALLAGKYETKLPRVCKKIARRLNLHLESQASELSMLTFDSEYMENLILQGELEADRRGEDIAALLRG